MLSWEKPHPLCSNSSFFLQFGRFWLPVVQEIENSFLLCCFMIFCDPRRGCYIVLSMFIFFSFFFFFLFFSATILSGPYLWNRYSQRLQIQCAAWSCGLVVHYCLPSNSLRYFFFFFFFFFAKILSGSYLWNRYSQRLQIECAAWFCGLVLHYCLPSNSLCYFFILFIFFFFLPRFCPGHISGTITCRDSKLSAAWSCGLILHCCLPSNSLRYWTKVRGIASRSHTGWPRTCLVFIYYYSTKLSGSATGLQCLVNLPPVAMEFSWWPK